MSTEGEANGIHLALSLLNALSLGRGVIYSGIYMIYRRVSRNVPLTGLKKEYSTIDYRRLTRVLPSGTT